VKRGRKTKFTPALVDEICKYVEMGGFNKDAAELAGVGHTQFYLWLKTKPEFAERLNLAMLRCKQRNIALIQKHATTTWQAAAWWLERKFSSEFALPYRMEHSGPKGQPVQFQKIPEKEADKLINRIGPQTTALLANLSEALLEHRIAADRPASGSVDTTASSGDGMEP
jgi:hypothetical protein